MLCKLRGISDHAPVDFLSLNDDESHRQENAFSDCHPNHGASMRVAVFKIARVLQCD